MPNDNTAQRLREFTATLQKYKTGKASLERRVIAAENWWKLRNRCEEQKQGLGDDGGFKSVSGWLHNVIVSKHADAMEAYPEPLILPREEGDKQQAKLLSSVVPCILEQNNFESIYDHAMWQKLKTGTAVYRVIWDPDKLNGLGDISIDRVDLLNLFWEPGVRDIQDSRYIFCTHLEDEDVLEEKYPALKGRMKSSPFTATRFVYDDAVSTEGKATVIEVYYKKRVGGKTVLHYCKYVGDTVLYSTEDQPSGGTSFDPEGEGYGQRPAGGDPVKASPSGGMAQASLSCRDAAIHLRWRREPTDEGMLQASSDAGARAIRESPMQSGAGQGADHAACAGLYDHGRYPFVLDPLFPVEGSPCGYGFVDLCSNTQTSIDLMRTAFIKNTMVGATPRYFQRIDGSVNEEEFSDLNRNIVHVSGNLGEDSLRQIGFSGLPGAYLQVLESTIRELRETTGNTETATGTVNSGVTAASAIAALQEASGKGSRDSTRASYQAYSQIVELCIELIRQFYSLPRQFRISGRLGDDEFVSLSNQYLRDRPVYGPAGLELGMTRPVFDVKVSAQKRNAYSRLSQNELAMELYKLGLFEQGRETQAMGCLELMEFDGKEELMTRLVNLSGLREKLQELEKYRSLALALAKRYRPDMALGLLGADAGVSQMPQSPRQAAGDGAGSLSPGTAPGNAVSGGGMSGGAAVQPAYLP